MQRLLLFICFMAIGTGTVYLLSVGESPPVDSDLAEIPPNVLAMEGVAIRQHEGPGLRLELFAQRAEFHERTGESVMHMVRFNLYGLEDGASRPQIEGTAAKALMSKTKSTVELAGSVRIVNADGAIIRSERIHYDQKNERAVSPGAVRVESQGVTHRGASMVYDIPGEKIQFTAPVFFER